MNSEVRLGLFTVGVLVVALVGVQLILQSSAALTTVGIVLVIGSAIALLVDVKDFLLVADRKAGKDRKPGQSRKAGK